MGSLRDKIYQMAEKACIPLAVHFDLTYRCNLRCIHCYLPERDRYPSPSYREELKGQNRAELATQEIYGILDQLAECGTLFLTFSGGEIFLRHDIMDIVGYARKKRFNVSLLTTGTIGVDENTADRFADMGVHAVDISLYSDESEVHDSVTMVPGSFSKTIKAIELFNERGMKVRIKCPLMKTNVGTHRSLTALAESYGVDRVFDSNLTTEKDGGKRPTYVRMDDDELRGYYSSVMEMSEGERGEDTRKISAPIGDDPLDGNPCGASHSSCYISPYGDVQPCIEITMICGSLRKKPFKEIWENSEAMLTVRSIKAKDMRKCSDCTEPNYCHRCMGQAYAEHGDLLAPVEELCRNLRTYRQIHKEVKQNA